MSLSRRRTLLRALLASAAIVGTRRTGLVLAQAPPKLVVFVPADIPSHALQQLLRDAIRGAEITVFSRLRDFETALGAKPDAVLSLQPVLRAKGLSSTIAGKHGGSSTESYSLIAIGRQMSPDKVTSVGAVDVLGRLGMKDLVARMLGTSPRVERVSKLEDLLPLLQFGTVEAVLLPERLVASFQARSKLDLRANRAPGVVGLPALAVLSDAGASLVPAIKALRPEISEQMGVQKWE
jgi:hypothetical protein